MHGKRERIRIHTVYGTICQQTNKLIIEFIFEIKFDHCRKELAPSKGVNQTRGKRMKFLNVLLHSQMSNSEFSTFFIYLYFFPT